MESNTEIGEIKNVEKPKGQILEDEGILGKWFKQGDYPEKGSPYTERGILGIDPHKKENTEVVTPESTKTMSLLGKLGMMLFGKRPDVTEKEHPLYKVPNPNDPNSKVE
ncbi:MAG: hypothetical protein WCV81_05950 [Microgenomates group bacterium]|jgi:hypothetical protein